MRSAEETEFGWRWQGRSYLARWRFALETLPGVGRFGEWVALCHLQRLGWDVVCRNWRCKQGEVDLVAYDGATLVFLEVKTRTTDWLPEPTGAVTEDKLVRLERLAFRFLNQFELADTPFRLDTIGVLTYDFRDFTLTHWIG